MKVDFSIFPQYVTGEWLCHSGEMGHNVDAHIAIDTREIQEGDIFVALPGEKTNGHTYIPEAIHKGASLIVTMEKGTCSYGGNQFLVKDGILAMQELGQWARNGLTMPILGISGSIGKTTSREMTALALSSALKIYRTEKNYNNLLGVPITLSRIPSEADFAVLEMGMNTPGELGDIARLARPTAVMLTNIGDAHMVYYGSRENICREKFTICEGLGPGGPVFLNGDDLLLVSHQEMAGDGHPIYLYGFSPACQYRAENVETENGYSRFTFATGNRRISVSLQVLGRHNIINALGALAVCDVFGIPLEGAVEALSGYRGFSGRLQRLDSPWGTFIDDTYNASPVSMSAGISIIDEMKVSGRKIMVLGDMFELGENAAAFHRDIGKKLSTAHVDVIILRGELMQQAANILKEHHFPGTVLWVQSNEEIQNHLMRMGSPENIIYLKASHGMHFSDIVREMVQEKR